jgi:hypothetical protein
MASTALRCGAQDKANYRDISKIWIQVLSVECALGRAHSGPTFNGTICIVFRPVKLKQHVIFRTDFEFMKFYLGEPIAFYGYQYE